MADKKMTDLTDLSTAVASDDIVHIVDDPENSPVNKKVNVFNLFGNLNHLFLMINKKKGQISKQTLTKQKCNRRWKEKKNCKSNENK